VYLILHITLDLSRRPRDTLLHLAIPNPLLTLPGPSLRQMPRQSFFTLLMHSMSMANLTQTIPHQELVVRRSEEGCGNVDQNCDPGIVLVRESFAPEENGGHHPCTEITREIGGNGDVGEAPDHIGVGEADDERCRVG
jgi:hypothetical protein